MSKVKEKVTEEVKKEKGEVEQEKEGRGGKKKMEKLEEEVYVKEKAIGRQEEKREKQIDNLSALLKSAPQIKRGADSSTRKRFTDLLQEVRPVRSTQVPKEHVLGKRKSKQRKFQPQPKRKECQHMLSVKSLSKGWGFDWQGTRDGKIYHLPENSDTGFYKLTDPHRPTSENCPCMRLTPVQFAPEPKTRDIRHQNANTKTGPKVYQTKPKKSVFGNTVVDSIQIDPRELTRLVLHPMIYGNKSGTTSQDPDRTKAANLKRSAAVSREKRAKKLKEETKERNRFLHQTETKKPKDANKRISLPSQKKQKKCVKEKEKKKESSIKSSPISEEVIEKVKMRILELEEQVAETEMKEPLSAEKKEQNDSKQTKKLRRTRGGAQEGELDWPSPSNIPDHIALLEAKNETAKIIANIGIEVAATNPGHEIRLYHPLPNNANGDCSFESTTDQLNNTRNSESNRDFANLGAGMFPEPIDLRRAVVKALMNNEIAIEKSGFVGREEEYRTELKKLLDPTVWDTQLGDVILPGIALVVKKNLLVYRTNTQHDNSPVFVVSPTEFGGVADTQIPIILCYTGSHFEGLVPRTATDVEKTVQLLQAFEEGSINVTVNWHILEIRD